MGQSKQQQAEIYPDVKIGVREDGSAYYAKDLAAELQAVQHDNQAELSSVAKLFFQNP